MINGKAISISLFSGAYGLDLGMEAAGADYGVPQNRLRVVFIGSRDNEAISFPLATHSKDGKFLTPWLTLRDALTDLTDPNPEFLSYSESRLKFLKLLKGDQNWRYLPEDLKKEAMGGAYNSGGGKVGFYRRLSWDKPCPTVTTSPHQKATDMCHFIELRPLSVREYARVQTFPDNWEFCGSVASKYKQIGNAVPILLASSIGKYIYSIIEGKTPQGQTMCQQLSLFPL
jgi:DNA (cytosine-5)-methyltransferase 1